MVMNNTGVIPARVTFTKDTGGKFKGLVLMNEGLDSSGNVPVIVDEQIFPGRRVALSPNHWFTIAYQDEQRFYLTPEFDVNLLPQLLEEVGITPTPYYLGKIPLEEQMLRLRYQTIFAQQKKSVAAPTASLHFTEKVFDSLSQKGIQKVEVTLDVGLGTFAEVEQKNIDEKVLHRERVCLSKDTVLSLHAQIKSKKPVLAVGTTVVRTLESQGERIHAGVPEDIVADTSIFIMEGYTFTVVDQLITNFHVPQSSLMALVSAFLEHKKAKRTLLELYEIAKKEGFQFYSFGDAMLIL
jgi:S-adenosylmethionine:tRNA ribosyltransferase-isomerase